MRSNHRTEAKELADHGASKEGATNNVLGGAGRSILNDGYSDIDGKKGQENTQLDADQPTIQSPPYGFLGRSNGWER